MLETRELSPDFGVEIQNVVLTEIVGATADAILSAAAEHALLLFRRQSLHDEDIYRLSSALGSVEEPAAKVNHSPRFKEINYIGNINSLDGSLIGSPTENTGRRVALGSGVSFPSRDPIDVILCDCTRGGW